MKTDELFVLLLLAACIAVVAGLAAYSRRQSVAADAAAGETLPTAAQSDEERARCSGRRKRRARPV